MPRTPKAEKGKNLFLLVILAAFLLLTVPYLRIPLSIGEHTYTGGLYRQDTGELVETVSLTLSGTRTYCLRRSGRSVEGEASVTIGSFSKDWWLISRATAYGCFGGSGTTAHHTAWEAAPSAPSCWAISSRVASPTAGTFPPW